MISPSTLLPQGSYGLKLPSIIPNPCFPKCFCVHQVEHVLACPKWISIGTAHIWDIALLKALFVSLMLISYERKTLSLKSNAKVVLKNRVMSNH